MTTITMTFRQLQQCCLYRGKKTHGCYNHAWRLNWGVCKSSNTCPIWRRAEAREKREDAKEKAALWKAAGTVGQPVKKPHPIAGYAMADYCECCQKPIKGRTYRTADDVKLCRACYGELAKEPVGRSGTPLVKDGKIVRLPVKRSCGNCGDFACGSQMGAPCKFWKPRRKG